MAKQLSTDEESILKRQARRRLIGAIALTTAAVVILPMVLDREPAPSAQDIELRIPDKDKVGEFSPGVAMPVASAVVAEPEQEAAAVMAPQTDAKPAAVAAKPKEVAPAKPAPATDPKPVAKPKVEAKSKSVPKPVEKAVVPHSGFIVQVGAFSNAETAKHLQAQLSRQGYHAYTEKAGDKTRVRIGSFPTHDAAEKIQRKLETQGLHPDVVNLN